MPYANFRYIAYEVPTATFATGVPNAPVVCNFQPGPEPAGIARLPVPNDTPTDARIRLRRLAGIVDLAHQTLTAKGDAADTLKVFVVPEFYFRPPSGLGPDYESDTYPNSVFQKIIQALDKMFQHVDFKDWLFVPGTILYNDKNFQTDSPLFRNIMPHIRGGRENSMWFIEKNLPSGIDGMPLVGIPAFDRSYGLYHASWYNQRQHVSTFDGVPVGFEVCLDHLDGPASRVLKTVLSRWQVREGNVPPALKLHVLCSAGMTIQPRSVSAAVNGYILRNDGIANPGARSTLQQVSGYKSYLLGLIPRDTTPDNINGTATLRAALAAEWATAIPGNLQVPQNPGFSTFAQRLVFYPARGL